MKTKILFVCLGNICRSPAAEGVFLNLLMKKGLTKKFEIDSAGTGSWHVGQPADARMREAAENRDISLLSISRQITLDDFKYFDLILTMDKDNLFNVEALSKEVNQPIKSIIRPLLSYSKEAKISEVPDPYYGGEEGFDMVLDLLEEACDALLSILITED